MKKPVVDYRSFRLRRLNEPQFSHLKLLGTWLIYFALYFITENLIPESRCVPVHCWLDDVIPFNEIFVLAYVGWYLLIVVSLGYFLLYNIPSFKRLEIYIFITQMAAMAIYIAFPNRQDLRPETFPRSNILTWILGLIYSFDTSTNVCPSLHVAYSIGIMSVWLREKCSAWWKLFVSVACILICLSVAFVKQHSVVDIFAALPVCLLAEIIVYGKDWWLPRLTRKKA